ncbi:MAG: hypothetical protein IJ365_07200 [Clostridia bacterium]|nr:hypothetical protein [Clostridia bacterium]
MKKSKTKALGKTIRIAAIAVLSVVVAIFAIIIGYKYISGAAAVERQIAAMAEVATPSKEELEEFQRAYAGLSPQAKKLVKNYDVYLAMYDNYVQELVDGFVGSEDYKTVEKIVFQGLAKHVNYPMMELNRESRELVITLVAGADTEYYLINDPTQIEEYLQTVANDMSQVTSDAFQITSLYGIDVRAVVNTAETGGMEIIKVKNGTLEFYALGEIQQ